MRKTQFRTYTNRGIAQTVLNIIIITVRCVLLPQHSILQDLFTMDSMEKSLGSNISACISGFLIVSAEQVLFKR